MLLDISLHFHSVGGSGISMSASVGKALNHYAVTRCKSKRKEEAEDVLNLSHLVV